MYVVKVSRIKNDKSQKAFYLGDTISDDDFPKEVILDWLLTGVLDKAPEKKRSRYAIQDKPKKLKGSASKEKQSLGEGKDTPNG